MIESIINDYPELIQYLDIIKSQPKFLDYYDKNYIDDDMCIQRDFYHYARDIIKGRWPEAEPIIMKNPRYVWAYAYNVIQGRWPEAEPYIMKDPEWAYRYAHDVIRDRWIEAEPYIKENGYWYSAYMRNVRNYTIGKKTDSNQRRQDG